MFVKYKVFMWPSGFLDVSVYFPLCQFGHIFLFFGNKACKNCMTFSSHNVFLMSFVLTLFLAGVTNVAGPGTISGCQKASRIVGGSETRVFTDLHKF